MRNQVVPPPTVTLAVEGGTVEDGPARRVIPHLGGSNPYLQTVTVPNHTVSWIVETGGSDATFQITAASVKGGTVRSDRRPLR